MSPLRLILDFKNGTACCFRSHFFDLKTIVSHGRCDSPELFWLCSWHTVLALLLPPHPSPHNRFCLFFCTAIKTKRQQPPRRRKTLWDFLLDEMRLIATDYHEERKLARHLLRGVAKRAQLARRELCEVRDPRPLPCTLYPFPKLCEVQNRYIALTLTRCCARYGKGTSVAYSRNTAVSAIWLVGVSPHISACCLCRVLSCHVGSSPFYPYLSVLASQPTQAIHL